MLRLTLIATCGLALAAASLESVSPGMLPEGAFDQPLAADDACTADGGDCVLNALQLKKLKVDSGDEAQARRVPGGDARASKVNREELSEHEVDGADANEGGRVKEEYGPYVPSGYPGSAYNFHSSDITDLRCNRRCRAVHRMRSHAQLGAVAATPLVVPAGRQFLSFLDSKAMPAWDPSQGVCVPPGATLPASWAPSTELQNKLANISIVGNWSSAAEAAARGAYSELVDFIGRAGMHEKLGTDALEATINGAFAGSNMLDVRTHALVEGTDILLELAAPYLDPEQDFGELGKCSELQDGDLATLVSYALYIKQQAPHNATVELALERLENATNLALVACGTLQELLGFEPSSRLGTLPISAEDAATMTSIDRVYGMVLQEVDLIGLLANPRLQMPIGTSDYVADFWNYLSRYPFLRFSDYNASQLYNFDQNSYVVTHIPYIVTGYQRYEIYVSDAPWLFSYLRENFYAAMENTEHDLLAEFVDNLRQYGCTEENDAQTRDGTRYLLGRYKDAGNRWFNVLAPDEIDGERVSPYNKMHKAWTAYVGLHRRVFETPGPETYQRAAREMLALAQARRSLSGDGSAGAGQLSL